MELSCGAQPKLPVFQNLSEIAAWFRRRLRERRARRSAPRPVPATEPAEAETRGAAHQGPAGHASGVRLALPTPAAVWESRSLRIGSESQPERTGCGRRAGVRYIGSRGMVAALAQDSACFINQG